MNLCIVQLKDIPQNLGFLKMLRKIRRMDVIDHDVNMKVSWGDQNMLCFFWWLAIYSSHHTTPHHTMKNSNQSKALLHQWYSNLLPIPDNLFHFWFVLVKDWIKLKWVEMRFSFSFLFWNEWINVRGLRPFLLIMKNELRPQWIYHLTFMTHIIFKCHPCLEQVSKLVTELITVCVWSELLDKISKNLISQLDMALFDLLLEFSIFIFIDLNLCGFFSHRLWLDTWCILFMMSFMVWVVIQLDPMISGVCICRIDYPLTEPFI